MATAAGFKALGNSIGETTALVRSGAACFTAGTLVLTENGQKAVEDIEAGDKVYATDPESGESGYKEVVQTFKKETEVIVHVTYERDGEDSPEGTENSIAGKNTDTSSQDNSMDNPDYVVNLQSRGTTTVNTTLNHRFWTEEGWKSAGTLETGNQLTLADGEIATITDIRYEDTHATVYNFEVEDFHTYYVGTESVLVHNNGGNCVGATGTSVQGSGGTDVNAIINKRNTPDQDALIQLAKEAKKNGGATYEDAEILIDWAKEYNVPYHEIEIHPNRPGAASNVSHFHIGKTGHIPIIGNIPTWLEEVLYDN